MANTSPDRSKLYQRNLNLDEILGEINAFLQKCPEEKKRKLELPVVCILGVPRSGTTLIMQWLAATNQFCYPTNFLSRFALKPEFGALLQKMFFEKKYRFMNEFDDLPVNENVEFQSDLGKTKGVLAPHEFWFLWRRFFDFPEVPLPDNIVFSDDAFNGFSSACASMQYSFQKPLFLKALIINSYAALFARKIPQLFFIYIHRKAEANIASILNSRKKYFGTLNEWWSFKPEEFEKIASLTPAGQVAGQWKYINENIENQLEEIQQERWLKISYEDFCENPQIVYDELRIKLKKMGYHLDKDHNEPKSFKASSGHSLSDNELTEINQILMT